jgi:hypothetical protein
MRILPVVDEQKTGLLLQSTFAAGSEEGADPAGLGVGVAAGEGEGPPDAVGVALGGRVRGGAVTVLTGVGDGLRANGSSLSHSNTVRAVPMIPAATIAAKICTNVRCINGSPVQQGRQLRRPAASCCFA